MKKYLIDEGYTLRDSYNDITNKQFFLESVRFGNSATSTFGNTRLDRVETYVLFLKNIEVGTFKTKLESIINNALSGGVNVSLNNDIFVEKVENGYQITLAFLIEG